jgi:hypothetical protein
VIDKIKNQTHPVIKNYWTPLYEEEDEADDEEERQHEMNVKETTKKKNKPRNRPGGRQRSARILKLVIDLGATSHFLGEEENLPKIGEASTNIYLPDDLTMKATIKVQLPIPELPNKARDAIVVPGLKRNLGSVSKFSDAGYTTVFHPGEEGRRSHNSCAEH